MVTLIPAVVAVVAVVLGECYSATAFVIGTALCTIAWAISDVKFSTRQQLRWAHGMVVVALAWLVGAVLAAVPMHLSGSHGDPTDSLFEAMSGLTTTGMSVVHDLDHITVSMDLYRHLLQISGGLGVVIVVLSLFAAGAGGTATLYAAEARDERVLPNVVRAARLVFQVAGTYLVLGTAALVIALLSAGFTPQRSLYRAINLFFSSFSTGGSSW